MTMVEVTTGVSTVCTVVLACIYGMVCTAETGEELAANVDIAAATYAGTSVGL